MLDTGSYVYQSVRMDTLMTPRIAVGRAVRGLMAEQGITQTAVAEAAGMTRSSLVKKLRGDIAISVDDLDRLAIALGVQVSAILQNAERIRSEAGAA